MRSSRAVRRQETILGRVRAGRACHVGTLARQLGVSEMTVRRDLDALAAEGRIVRTHGGAAPASGVVFQFKFLERAAEHRAAKEAIARRAAGLVPDGAAVALDSGTTTLALARALRARDGLTVITSSLPIASELQYCEAMEVILLGGRLGRGSPDLGGALALRALEALHADIAFLGADAVAADGTCYHASLEVAHLVGAIAGIADAVYIVADSSKLRRTATARAGSLADWAGLITDAGLSSRVRRSLKAAGVNLIEVQSMKKGHLQ
ncbi:MAG: DeoR/GlpR transcriptional regulator [Lentisphaerae bacterium]|nr:DeoR/GlpR transcriptional regulator [Lentisphaerota bacterium]